MSKRSLSVLAVLASLALAGCSDDEPTQATDDPPSESSSSAPESTGVPCAYEADSAPSKEAELPPENAAYAGPVEVTMTTSIGDLAATLDADATPCTVNSFLSLAEQGYFDATTCHRLTTEGIFVLQCGDPTASGMGGPGYSFADELTEQETYGPGTLAMANAGPDTNGSQFFIVYGESPLPPAYAVFGSVDEASVKIVEDAAADGTAEGG
ncbi:MAG: peptidylprolyl isomerase, partial [Nocardioides sp.]